MAAREVLLAGLRLAAPASDGDAAQARRMVALLVEGLRYGAGRTRYLPPHGAIDAGASAR